MSHRFYRVLGEHDYGSHITLNSKRLQDRIDKLKSGKTKPFYLSDYMVLNPELVQTISDNLLKK
ncbi:MAG: hypothetical protein AABX29_04720 [Nanoarchaeota archaeon]